MPSLLPFTAEELVLALYRQIKDSPYRQQDHEMLTDFFAEILEQNKSQARRCNLEIKSWLYRQVDQLCQELVLEAEKVPFANRTLKAWLQIKRLIFESQYQYPVLKEKAEELEVWLLAIEPAHPSIIEQSNLLGLIRTWLSFYEN
ncbi:MAG: hypothetical protein AAFQ68_20145 [Bacteroidota bacterium]